MVLFAPPVSRWSQADVAQLVERNLAKVEVASSSLVVRSEKPPGMWASTVGWPRGEATDCKSVYTGSNPVPTSKQDQHHPPQHPRAIGAAVARFPDTEEVTGSIPVSSTKAMASPVCGVRRTARFRRLFACASLGASGGFATHAPSVSGLESLFGFPARTGSRSAFRLGLTLPFGSPALVDVAVRRGAMAEVAVRGAL